MVVVFTVPMAHLRGVPSALRERFGIPVVFYDGDVPMSLPEFGGRTAGFNYYHGADPSRVRPRRLQLRRRPEGAARAGRAPRRGDLLGRPPHSSAYCVEKEPDVFFYGYGDKFRCEWMAALVGEPTRALPHVDFCSAAVTSAATPALAVGEAPFNAFARRSPRAASTSASRAARTPRSTRRRRAAVRARSTGAAIVSNPYLGIEGPFETGHASCSCRDASRPPTAYRQLLADPAQAESWAPRPRARPRRAHLRHRARQLLDARRSPRGDCVSADASSRRRIAIVPAFNEEPASAR